MFQFDFEQLEGDLCDEEAGTAVNPGLEAPCDWSVGASVEAVAGNAEPNREVSAVGAVGFVEAGVEPREGIGGEGAPVEGGEDLPLGALVEACVDARIAVPAQQRWEEAAEAFVEMLLTMRDGEGGAGGGIWLEGMYRLIFAAQGSEAQPRRELGFDYFAGNLLRDNVVATSSTHPWAVKYSNLVFRLETFVVEATRHLNLEWDWTWHPAIFGTDSHRKARDVGADGELPFGGFGFGKRHLLFVGLPLTLYVSDCPHLYMLVRRMRALASLCKAIPPSAEIVRTVLDAEGRPYAVLAYAVLAALQALNAARLPNGAGAAGLEPLSASVIAGGGLAGCVKVATDRFGTSNPFLVTKGASVMFRGIWVPSVVDEEMAAFTWSFNSFSRGMEGVLSVLDFYALGEGGDQEVARLAREEAHALIYVVRLYTPDGRWAFPVQIFNTAFVSDVEKEVLVPPFVQYVYEDAAPEVSSLHSRDLQDRVLLGLTRAWGISLTKEAPLLLQLLKGAGPAFEARLDRPLRVTVRFVRCIRPAEPLRRLFGDRKQAPEDTLLSFPPIGGGDRSEPVKSPFGAGADPLWLPPLSHEEHRQRMSTAKQSYSNASEACFNAFVSTAGKPA